MRCALGTLTLFALAACAPDVSRYHPPLDPALVTQATNAHVRYCDALVQKTPPERDWKGYLELAANTSLPYWITALLSKVGSAFAIAGGATAIGTGEGIHNDNGFMQREQESRVRQCLSNYHEPLTEKP